MKINWNKPPEFAVVGGSEWVLIRKFVEQITASASSAGLKIHTVDSASSIDSIMSPNFWEIGNGTDSESVPFIVFRGYRASEQLPAEFSTGKKSFLLYVVDGEINKTSCPIIHKVPESLIVKLNKFHGSWNKSLEHSVSFLESEFKARGFHPEHKVLESLVRTSGFELGVLKFEVEKAVYAAMAMNKDTIDMGILKGTVKPTNHFDMTPMRESLASRQPVKFLQFTNRAYSRSVSDPTMVLLRGKGGVGDLAISWLQVAMMVEGSIPASEISRVTGVPVWALSKDSFPAVRRWGVDRLKALVRNISEVDSGFVLGCPNPKVKLESAVVSAMQLQ